MAGAIYTDFNQLAQLRVNAQQDQSSALEDTAAQFESLFIQMMLKSMRDATEQGGLFDSTQMETYQAMADQQISLELSQNGGIGIARAMIEQMQARGFVPTVEGDTVNAFTDPALEPPGLPVRAIDIPKAYPIRAANTSTVDERA